MDDTATDHYGLTLPALPHLGRVEAILYLILYYVFGTIHPKYQLYIDAVGRREALAERCRYAQLHEAYWTPQPDPFGVLTRTHKPMRETDLPDIYFALLSAVRLIRLRLWARQRAPYLAFCTNEILEPG